MMSTTSVKLPNDLKTRAARAAQARGLSAHAFLVQAIRQATEAAECKADFIADAQGAREEILASGKAYTAEEVHRYIEQKTRGKHSARPKRRAWRE